LVGFPFLIHFCVLDGLDLQLEMRSKPTARRLFMFEGILQPMHLLVILVIALVVFGPKNLPGIGKGLGEAIRGFKKALNEDDTDLTKLPTDSKTGNERDEHQAEQTTKPADPAAPTSNRPNPNH
jgi:sec-independent protein translocase protein TatA